MKLFQLGHWLFQFQNVLRLQLHANFVTTKEIGMKTIGLIGGMGWESSKLYYDYVNRFTQKRLGGSHSAKVILVSVNFAEIEKLTFQKDWHEIGEIVAQSAQQLEQAGADMVVLCTNLIHLVSETIKARISIPFIHIADATGASIQQHNLKKILLLGTQDTMEKDFYSETLRDNFGREVIVPLLDDRELIHEIIYTQLLKGVFAKSSKEQIIDIIKKEQVNDVEGVILGCTELTLLITKDDLDLLSFDTAKIHAEKAVELSLLN